MSQSQSTPDSPFPGDAPLSSDSQMPPGGSPPLSKSPLSKSPLSKSPLSSPPLSSPPLTSPPSGVPPLSHPAAEPVAKKDAAAAASPVSRQPSQQPPPPPPPISPAPVRPAPVPKSAPHPLAPAPETGRVNGVGSAKGIRWRGELPAMIDGESQSSASSSASQMDQEDQARDIPQRAKDAVTRGAPPWLVSTVVHLIALLVLALITSPVGPNNRPLLLNFGHAVAEPRPELAVFDLDPTIEPVDQSPSESFDQVEVPSVFEELEFAETQKMDLGPMPEIQVVGSGLGDSALSQASAMFAGRNGAMKQSLISIFGGTPETQDAVALGLKWLKKNQKADGSWSMRGPYRDAGFSENECSATAMALIAFLGDGNTHESGEYRDEVSKGIKRLVKMQDRSGFFADDARGHEKMYAQAQATIAICELYGMTKDSWLRPYAQAAIDFAESSQSRLGGWRYEPNRDADTSVTGWFVMALASGRSAGLEVDLSQFLAVNGFLDKAAVNDGAGYSYEIGQRDATPAMTAEGLLCRQYLTWKREHPKLVEGIDALINQAPFDLSDGNVYYWYYATQVLHHYGGEPWERWNEIMRTDLPRAQTTKGNEAGSWPPQSDVYGNTHGRLYTTCLSIYCLEVYYRHMPLYAGDGGRTKQ